MSAKKAAKKVPAKKAATKVATKAAGKKPAPLYAEGDLVMFTEYVGLGEGEARIIPRDETVVKVESAPEWDGGRKKYKYAVSVVSQDEEDLTDEGEAPQDTLFEDEVRVLTADEESAAAETLANIEAEADNSGESGDDASLAEAAEAEDLTALGDAADEDDEDAVARLTELAEEHDLDPEEFDTWAKLATKLKKLVPAAGPAKKVAAPGKGRGKGKQEPAETEEVVVSSSVKKMLKGGDAHEAAVALNAKISSAWFDFGGLLLVINSTKAFCALEGPDGVNYSPDKDGFDAYVQAEFGVKVATAYHWMRIHKAIVKLGKNHDALKGLGWDKAIYLAQAIKSQGFALDDDEFGTLVEFARENSRAELANHVRTTYVDVEGDDAGPSGKAARVGKGQMVKVVRKFTVFGDQAAGVVDSALEAARTTLNTDDDGQALVHICTEWGQLSEQDIPLEVAIAALEGRYSVKVTVDETAAKKTAKPAKKTASKKVAKKATAKK